MSKRNIISIIEVEMQNNFDALISTKFKKIKTVYTHFYCKKSKIPFLIFIRLTREGDKNHLYCSKLFQKDGKFYKQKDRNS